jgi:hypothetical protein
MQLGALLVIAVLVSSEGVLAQGASAGAAPPGASSVPNVRAKPTAAEKRCLASRRRVERQNEVIAEADARIAKERTAREGCKTKRACENLDRALNASETRRQRHEKQFAQFESEARKACATPAGATTWPPS